jgi:hypothetical protein
VSICNEHYNEPLGYLKGKGIPGKTERLSASQDRRHSVELFTYHRSKSLF